MIFLLKNKLSDIILDPSHKEYIAKNIFSIFRKRIHWRLRIYNTVNASLDEFNNNMKITKTLLLLNFSRVP